MSRVPADLDDLLHRPFAPQKAFRYPAARWSKWVGHLDGVSDVLETLPSELDRALAARRIDELLADNVAGAFVVAMIWGHGSSGYGPYRTARILTDSTAPASSPLSEGVIEKLTRSVSVAQDGDAVLGYRFLTHASPVRGLGPAFFTKWLYFVTARGNPTSPLAAPILDALVINWMRKHAGVRIRAGYTIDYRVYLDHLTAWGAATDHTPVEVEERIFRLMRDDGAVPADPSPGVERTHP
ncbi:hypothetical protein HQ308_14875 [Rhodococcus sp. BP-241]|uniref:8-oxoguanine DNA glycosylase OGG fold protein n=1 Tax=Rhodococcus sp. BP-241 TaxID=2739441 RepID=UPI001C9B1463|nr:hypothetical protein [Rhodococcus sp. BP-241]MBY6708087.1 hypothetical protein [Rhodococcus sp. BP-241]